MEGSLPPPEKEAAAEGVLQRCTKRKAEAKGCSGPRAAAAVPVTNGKLTRMPQAMIDQILARTTKPPPPPANARTAAGFELYWEHHLRLQDRVRSEYESKGFVESVDNSAYFQAIMDESDDSDEHM